MPKPIGSAATRRARLRRRRRLLWYSLPVCLAAGLLVLKLTSLSILSHLAHGQYAKQAFAPAERWLSPVAIMNWFEPYIVAFHQGNIAFKQGKFDTAETHYRRALETVPEHRACDVRINLALSLEAQADAAASKKDFTQAVLHYDTIKAVLAGGPRQCGITLQDQSGNQSRDSGDDSDGQQSPKQPQDKQQQNAQTARQIQQRTAKKSADAKRARNNDGPSDKSDKADKADNNETEKKIDQLEKNSTKAQKERSRTQSERRSERHNKQAPRRHDAKNW